ncbi:MAG: sugar phosphate isomerase/epimerase [Oscillospiraceae bacterium]|nr:sugar phosphate isomerase/epimerase [Oscillospiraceae bacterium]
MPLLAIRDRFCDAGGPVAQNYPLIAQAGFDGVMIEHRDPLHPPKQDAIYRTSQKAALAKANGLRIFCAHASYMLGSELMDNGEKADAPFHYMMDCLRDLSENEVPVMVAHAGSEALTPKGMDRFARLAAEGQRLGVRIALENLRDRGEVMQVIALLQAVRSPYLGLCFDAGHNNANADLPPLDLPAIADQRLFMVHLHDNDGKSDQHMMPYDGTIDWAVTMRSVAKANRAVPILLELVERGHAELSPPDFLALAYARAKKLAALHEEAVCA